VRRHDGSFGAPSNYLALPNFAIGVFNTPHDFFLGTVRGTDHARRAYYLAKYGQGGEAFFEGATSVFEYSSALLKGIGAAEGISSLGSGLKAAAVDLVDAFGESVTGGGGLAYATPGGYTPIDGLPPAPLPDLEPGTAALSVGGEEGTRATPWQAAIGEGLEGTSVNEIIVDDGHILDGTNGGGFHYAGEPNPFARTVAGTETAADVNGVYTADVEFYDPGTGQWVPKNGAGMSTFFPDAWSRDQVLEEVWSAFEQGGGPEASGRWFGVSESGVPIEGWFRDGRIASAYPLKR
jgi:hypothetical protein